MIRILRVQGDSLSPQYRDADFVVVVTKRLRLRVGDTVVFRHPVYGTLIKQVKHIEPDGALWVEGVHPHSVDSRTFGPVPRTAVVGRVLWHVSRK